LQRSPTSLLFSLQNGIWIWILSFSMVDFLDLPIDLLPCILSFIVKSNHLAAAARVDKTWNAFATPLLYERVSIYSWHKEGKVKVRTVRSSRIKRITELRYLCRSCSYSPRWAITCTSRNMSVGLVRNCPAPAAEAQSQSQCVHRDQRLSQSHTQFRRRHPRASPQRSEELPKPTLVYLDARWFTQLRDSWSSVIYI
jgi:hypothetical protein